MFRIYCLQQWYNLSDPAAEEALYDSVAMRHFAGVSTDADVIPDETSILNFRRLLEKHELTGRLLCEINAHLGERGLLVGKGTIVDATILNAPSSSKNAKHERDPVDLRRRMRVGDRLRDDEAPPRTSMKARRSIMGAIQKRC